MTSRSADELASKFAALGDGLRGSSKTGVNKAAHALEDVFYDEAMRSIRGPNLAGKKWGTRTKPARSVANPQALVSYKGPVHWFEGGTKAHQIMSKKVVGVRANMSYRDAVTGGLLELSGIAFGGKVRWAVTSGPMKPRPFFARVKNRGPDIATRVYARESFTKPIADAAFGRVGRPYSYKGYTVQ